jgi:hypothetical protein
MAFTASTFRFPFGAINLTQYIISYLRNRLGNPGVTTAWWLREYNIPSPWTCQRLAPPGAHAQNPMTLQSVRSPLYVSGGAIFHLVIVTSPLRLGACKSSALPALGLRSGTTGYTVY